MGPFLPGRMRLSPAARLFLGVLTLAAVGGCRGPGPMQPFDAGQDVHVILRTKGAPEGGLRVQTVSTVGREVARSAVRRLGGSRAPEAVEVAVLRVPSGRHRFSFLELRTRTAGQADLDVRGARWVVVEMTPGRKDARVSVYDGPPHDAIGTWRPFIAVPD